jgi:hypothetical protein
LPETVDRTVRLVELGGSGEFLSNVLVPC